MKKPFLYLLLIIPLFFSCKKEHDQKIEMKECIKFNHPYCIMGTYEGLLNGEPATMVIDSGYAGGQYGQLKLYAADTSSQGFGMDVTMSRLELFEDSAIYGSFILLGNIHYVYQLRYYHSQDSIYALKDLGSNSSYVKDTFEGKRKN